MYLKKSVMSMKIGDPFCQWKSTCKDFLLSKAMRKLAKILRQLFRNVETNQRPGASWSVFTQVRWPNVSTNIILCDVPNCPVPSHLQHHQLPGKPAAWQSLEGAQQGWEVLPSLWWLFPRKPHRQSLHFTRLSLLSGWGAFSRGGVCLDDYKQLCNFVAAWDGAQLGLIQRLKRKSWETKCSQGLWNLVSRRPRTS